MLMINAYIMKEGLEVKKLGQLAVVLLTMCLTISACGGVATEEKKPTPADQTKTESTESETAAGSAAGHPAWR